jgi:hypothetical protein
MLGDTGRPSTTAFLSTTSRFYRPGQEASANQLAEQYQHHLGFNRRLVVPTFGVRPPSPGSTQWPFRPLSATSELRIVPTITTARWNKRPQTFLAPLPEQLQQLQQLRPSLTSSRSAPSFARAHSNEVRAFMTSGHPGTLCEAAPPGESSPGPDTPEEIAAFRREYQEMKRGEQQRMRAAMKESFARSRQSLHSHSTRGFFVVPT